jgi:uncharacterized protein involved in exopolysaccharide biosynthesis
MEKESQGSPGEQVIDLREYWLIVVKRKWTILTFFMVLVTSVAIGSIKQPKIFQATASIIIDTTAPEVLTGVREVVGMGPAGYFTNKEFYETQYKILQSRSLARKVVNQLNLSQNASFMGNSEKEFSLEDKNKSHNALNPETIFLSKLKIVPIKDSRIVQINIQDGNPQFAALLANTVADEYIEMNLETKLEATRNAANWLAEQMDDLKNKMEKSELSLYLFKKENKLLSVSLEDHQNMTTQKLRVLNETLSKIQANRIEVEAKRKHIYELKSGKKDLESLQLVLNNQTIQKLKDQYFKAQTEYAEMKNKYGEKHPKYKIVTEQLELAKKGIEKEIEIILTAIDSEYAMTLETEKSLQSSLEEIKNQALEINKKEIDYNKLKRESDNNASLYGMVLKRLKETD